MSTFGAFTVTRAGTKNVLGSNGLYQSVANNVPAFEFNTDGTYRGLLVEPGATNITNYSEQFDNAYWSKVAVTVTANASTAPSGEMTADKLIPTAVSSQHRIDLTSTTTAVNHSFSVFAKADGYGFISLRMGSRQAGFSLATGASNTVEASTTANSVQFPNGWWRFSISGTAGVNSVCRINVENAGSIATTFTGDGTSGVLFWGAQLEASAVATSYIPTVASTASRVADSVTLTGASSLIGQTEGVVYCEVVSRSVNLPTVGRIVTLSDGTTNNRIGLTRQANFNNRFQCIVANSGSITAQIQQGVDVAENAVTRMAIAYKLDDIAYYINGASIGTDTSSAVPACSRIDIGNQLGGEQFLNGWIRCVAIFPSRLADATLATLTT